MRKPFKELAEPNKRGMRAEAAVAQFLRQRGRHVTQMVKVRAPFDLLVDGWRIDVKCASMQWSHDVPTWLFTILRHARAKTRIENTDLYVLRIEDVPYTAYAVHLLFRAPLNVKCVSVSLRSMLTVHARHVVEFENFSNGVFGQKDIAA